MTVDEVREACRAATLDLPAAGRCFDLGRAAAYAAYHRGEFPTRVLRVGQRIRVPSADVLLVLGLVPPADDESADKPLTCDDTAPDHTTVTPRPSLAAVESTR